jgi:diguanylate cyclase (GGDEF)-like protein/PAS domain S-box-containing protein
MEQQTKATVIKLLSEAAPQSFHLIGDAVTGADLRVWEQTLNRRPPRTSLVHQRGGSVFAELTEDNPHLLTSLAVEHCPDGIVIIRPANNDEVARILYVNRAFLRMSGMSREEMVGQELQIFRMNESDQTLRDSLLHPLCQRQAFEGEAVASRKNGSEYSVELLLMPLHDENGAVAYWVAYLKDISERKAQLAALERQAMHDVLTGLPNRTLLVDRIEQAILVARRTKAPVALMVMDLDGFKEINDTLGHHAGDLLLQQVAKRLLEEIRESDTVARLGGDEFAFVLPTVEDSAAAIRFARRILKALERPFELENQKCEVGASIGVAMFPEHGGDSATLMRRADSAMYHAKRGGRGCSLYNTTLTRSSGNALALGAELREAIENDYLRVYYQPKVHLRTGLVTRVEALVRWAHPERGLILPDNFIPLAERSGLIKPLTEWVLNNSLKQCADWQRRGLPLHIAVNLSPKILLEHVLPQTIATMLDRWKLPPRSLKLEITESSIMADPPHVLAILSLLQTLGVRLSLDDFGTGYSSLMHLRQLPVDEIKIDKSFVMGMRNSASDAAIVRATIDLAHSLGRQVVAEGVDDDETCRTLATLGCDLAQGYSFARPLPADEFETWLSDTQWGLTRWRELMLPDDALPKAPLHHASIVADEA